MGLSEILAIIIIILLILVIAFQLISRPKKAEDISALMDRKHNELQEKVYRQLQEGTTQQFARFDVMQKNMNETLQGNRDELNKQLALLGEQLDNRLSGLQEKNVQQNEKVNNIIDNRLQLLQDSNEKRLEKIQGVVDEKLQKTLESRIAKSFEQVGKQLETVQQGLGEMRILAADTKSLKNVLTNVKERGTYGEIRLEKLLADILAPTQYEANVEIANGKRVEFVVKLPGKDEKPLLLPIDSKFPLEDYNRLLEAEDKAEIEEIRKSIGQKIKASAKEIHDKYIYPPVTADFALLFLPTEGLYAEVIQNAALFEELRNRYKVTVVGATTLSAFLASLQMGFKTLAIEQRSMEVWDTLRSVKAEFEKFGGLLEKARSQIKTADKTLETLAGTRSRAIERRLRSVELLKGQEEEDIEFLDEVEEIDED